MAELMSVHLFLKSPWPDYPSMRKQHFFTLVCLQKTLITLKTKSFSELNEPFFIHEQLIAFALCLGRYRHAEAFIQLHELFWFPWYSV